MFLKESGLLPPDPAAQKFPVDAHGQMMQSENWKRRDGLLRISVDKYGRGNWKDLGAEDGWALTPDFTTDPPSVILKKDGDFHWAFVRAEGPPADGAYYYLESTTSDGKTAWLTLGAKVVRYTGSYEACAPVLTPVR